MRVTFITHYKELYGANRSLLNLLDGLRAYDVQPSVICHSAGPITAELTRRGIPFCIFPMRMWFAPPQPRHWLNGMVRFLENAKNIPSLKKSVKLWKPDIIYTNTSVTPVGALLARALDKPHVWHIREFAIDHFGWQPDLGENFFRYWLNRAAGVVAISQAVKEGVLRDVRSRTHVIANGVISAADLEKMPPPAARHTVGKKVLTFAIAGVIHPSKGQREALEALALLHRKHPEAELLIAGSGQDDYVRQLQALARDLGVGEKAHFLGFVDDIYPVFDRADAVLTCSRFEAMGRVTAEAMAAGKPVIGCNSAGTAELIEHGRDGLLYQGGADSLAACMEELIETPGLVIELGQSAREKAKTEFTVEAYSRKMFEVLDSSMPKTGKREHYERPA